MVGHGGRPHLTGYGLDRAILNWIWIWIWISSGNALKLTCLLKPKSGWSGFERRFPCSYLANRLGMGIIIEQARRSGRYQNFIGAASKQEKVLMVAIRHH